MISEIVGVTRLYVRLFFGPSRFGGPRFGRSGMSLNSSAAFLEGVQATGRGFMSYIFQA